MQDLKFRNEITSITAQAPATLSNLAVGFDILGVAINTPHDSVTLHKRHDNNIIIQNISNNRELTTDIQKNTASVALKSVLDTLNLNHGFDIFIQKGIPIGSGMGGSAASAVAALTALNGFFKTPLALAELLPHAAKAEAVVSGTSHLDNVAPCLWGGLVLCEENTIQQLPTPTGRLIIAMPNIEIETKSARQCLPENIPLQKGIAYAKNLAAWIHCIHTKNTSQAACYMQDDIIEPARLHLWPHYSALKNITQASGALATFISGSGPAVVSWVDNDNQDNVSNAIKEYCEKQHWNINLYFSSWNAPGAKITEIE